MSFLGGEMRVGLVITAEVMYQYLFLVLVSFFKNWHVQSSALEKVCLFLCVFYVY